MCGIAGIIKINSDKEITQENLTLMSDIISHRGPDGFGYFLNEDIGLAHRRLSILDLSENGKQPFLSNDERYVMVFNGEIYNYLELKELLSDKSDFKSNSDTEVLLRLYIEFGKEIFEKMNGMFSVVIWDSWEKSVFIIRDRLGVKPFNYAIKDGLFYFSSEEKSLLKVGISKELDENNLLELILYRFIAGENTIFKNIKKLPPGHQMEIANGNIKISRWWNLSERIEEKRSQNSISNFSAAVEWFKKTFNSSVKYRTISDVKVGVLLSGGLDSTSVASSLANVQNSNLESFTMGFEEKEINESDLAKLVSKKFGLINHSFIYDTNEIYNGFVHSSWLNDQPLIHQNDPHLHFIAKQAKLKGVSVLLSGEGSDELMGGYVRYKPLYYLDNGVPLKLIVNAILKVKKSFRLVKLKKYLDLKSSFEMVNFNGSQLYIKDYELIGLKTNVNLSTYREEIFEEGKKLFPKELARQTLYMDQHTYLVSLLERNDRMTMGASIECRVPFLDYRLVEQIGTFKSNWLFKGKKGKYLLLKSKESELPEEVLNFRKNGFSIPFANYLQNNEEMNSEFFNMHKSEIFSYSIFQNINFESLYKKFKEGDSTSEIFLRQMFMLAIWKKNYLDKF